MRTVIILVASLMLACCEARPQVTTPPLANTIAAVPQNGRYTFYLQQPKPGLFNEGFLLDTATGDMWFISYLENGKLGPMSLAPLKRFQQPGR